MRKNNPLAEDLDHIIVHTQDLWENVRGKRLFITGGTGFLGRWFLESLIWANNKLNLNTSALVLTRDLNTFKKEAPHLAKSPIIQFHAGNARNFDYPEGEFSYIIHAAATSARATFNKTENPLEKFDTLVQGTRHTLDFAISHGAKKFLFLSSGAIYGSQPYDMTHIPEDYLGAVDPTDSNSAWAEGKRAAEFLSSFYSKEYGIETKIARCFSFVGPYLPLDIHYAVGNFILDRFKNRPIIIRGDGSAYRSYLYAADAIIWLWTILFNGKANRPYNVGSEDEIDIESLANVVARKFEPKLEVKIAQKRTPNKHAERYVPLTKRARDDLNVRQIISLEESIRRTIEWNKSR